MHIRLTDFAEHLKSHYNESISIPNKYFTRAMRYCTNKYEHVLFYAVSDDIKTAKEKLLVEENKRFDIVFPGDGSTSSPAIDIALLSFADHSIISFGTFGMWGALLAGRGETIMSPYFRKTVVGSQIHRTHIKNWLFLGDR